MAFTKKLSEIFKKIDTSADHHIDWSELKVCCKEMNIQLTDEDRRLFRVCEDKKDSGLTFDGFCKFVKFQLRAIFDEIDTDSSGSINELEIRNALRKLHIHLPDRQIKSILKGMDTNNDNKIDYEEFCLFFADVPSPDFQTIAHRWQAGIGLDFGSDIAPTSIPPVEMPLIRFIIAGGVAGVVSRTLTAPLEKIKIIAQTSSFRTSFTKLFKHIVHAEGMRGLFAGNLTNCVRIFPSSALVCLVYSRMIKYTPVDNNKNPHQPLWRFFSGGVAGVVATSATHPLDVVRARLTVQDMSIKGTSHYTGIISSVKRIRLEEGFRGLYKGLSLSLISIVPFLGTQQCVYDVVKVFALKSQFGASPSTFFVCGAFAGITAQTMIHPLDVVRRQMQVNQDKGSIPQTSISALRTLWKKGGILRLYAGLTVSSLKVIPAAATSLLVRDALLGRLDQE